MTNLRPGIPTNTAALEQNLGMLALRVMSLEQDYGRFRDTVSQHLQQLYAAFDSLVKPSEEAETKAQTEPSHSQPTQGEDDGS